MIWKPKKTRQGRYEGLTFVSGEELNKRDEQKRLLELQELKNQGALDLADRRQTGALAVADRRQTGALDVTGRKQTGLSQRHQRALQMQQRELDLDQEKADNNFLFNLKKHQQARDQFNKKFQLSQNKQQFDQNEGYNLRVLKNAMQNSRPDEYGQMPDPSLYLRRLSALNNPKSPEELKRLRDQVISLRNPVVPEEQEETIYSDGSGGYTNTPTRTAQTTSNRPPRVPLPPREPSPMFSFSEDPSKDPWQPLKSVTQPLNRNLGNFADSMVDKFQRPRRF